MISSYGRDYLEKLNKCLDKLPDEERMDAVMEIESHIAEGIANGQPERVILARLGDPRNLAKAYRSEHMSGLKGAKSIKELFAIIGFYCATGLLSVMVIPVLATVAYGFGFCTILIGIAGVLRTLGVPWINMGIAPGVEVPREFSMVYALVVGAIIGGIAYISWVGLKKYLAFLSKRYKQALPGNHSLNG
ncbi:HAAS domain-containing protein [Paenibacillus sp.]|jgi:uncharacterized membrane protein|uniref:DUF1700 domain-containing protein n=1 Tax=Paenibacillus sp. TaxID=58172 RepID=UPI00281A438C|nr:DUF1700 domain-containing protein [Paenibacillus sp.]MDR0268124.1 DUF1700 domain-containing protein [Paenibacillus sp.]